MSGVKFEPWEYNGYTVTYDDSKDTFIASPVGSDYTTRRRLSLSAKSPGEIKKKIDAQGAESAKVIRKNYQYLNREETWYIEAGRIQDSRNHECWVTWLDADDKPTNRSKHSHGELILDTEANREILQRSIEIHNQMRSLGKQAEALEKTCERLPPRDK